MSTFDPLTTGSHRRRDRRRDGPRFPPILLVALLVALPVVLLFWLASLTRGPVASSDWLRRARSPEREALSRRAFLKAQTALAESDSINIVLDAREKKLFIVLKGVQLRECNLISVQLDRTIQRLVSGRSEGLWLERPFVLEERRGDIPDPWMPVMEGPVDTLTGGTLARELPMNGELRFDRRLVLHVATPMSHADSLEYQGFNGFLKRLSERRDDAIIEVRENLSGPASFDLYVRLNREDAAAVLRALPVGGGMALHL